MNETAGSSSKARCPACDALVDADPSRNARRGYMRLRCDQCGNRFMLQVNRRELKISDSMETEQVPG